MSVVVDRWVLDLEELVETEILPQITVQEAAAGLAIAGVLGRVSVSPLFDRRRQSARDERRRQAELDEIEDERRAEQRRRRV